MSHKTSIGAFLAICGMLAAQTPRNQNENAAGMAVGSTPIYRITVVERTMKAINYNHRGGATNIGFRGTALLPDARGEARVESKQGVIKIDARMEKLQPATKYGPEYLTYVMWAITPEGRATNVGEVLLNGDRSKLDATTELQSFGLIVTAEPYFAVTQPSDVVVMENFVRNDTTGTIEQLDAKFELLQRGQYTLNVNPAELKPRQLDGKTPLELYEARNAVNIARWTGAERYAADTYLKATQGLENAEGYLKGKAGKKPIGTVAREAVQMAEDARLITVKKMDEERLATERKLGAAREARAEDGRTAALSETERVTREAEAAKIRSRIETDRITHEKDAQTAAAQAETDRVKRESDARMLAAQAETDRVKSENEARILAARAETDRVKRESEAGNAASAVELNRLKSENEARDLAAKVASERMKADSDAKIAAAAAEAERLKRENDAQRASSQAALDNAAKQKAQLEAERVELRVLLLKQFNAVLQTRDTARGLIVNMSDVLFDTGKYSLRPQAREKLAKIAGIVSGHPGLKLDVEGYTDSVGGDEYNQTLSEHRGSSVRDYLTHQGMSENSVTTKGFGKTNPVASNDTASGRQQNRRVEIVVSGEVIGTTIGIPGAAK